MMNHEDHQLSIVIPFYNEEESIVTVLEEVLHFCPHAEVIAVDDGSTDDTWRLIKATQKVHGLRLTHNCGQSAAIYAGLLRAQGDICVIMDGDGQNDPASIPGMLDALMASKADVVCGFRAQRKDSLNRKVASRVANAVRQLFFKDGVRDTGCSLKAFRREAVELLIPFNGLHRFLPVIFRHAGLTILEFPVNHRPRSGGVTKYTNWERGLRGCYDLFGVAWLLRRKFIFPRIECTEEISLDS